MQLYIAHLKQIFGNITLLYRNFLHWNISKICIFLYTNIIGLIISLPFIGVLVYQYVVSYSKLGLSVSPEAFILGNMSTILVSILIFLCIATIFICTYSYGNFLLQNVYKSYLAGEKLAYTKNLYFSWKHFRAYIGILGWIGLYLLAPIAVGLILSIPLGLLASMDLWIPYITVIVGIVSIIAFIALLAWFMHLAIRLIFSYYTLLYSDAVTKAKTYIDESFRLTKKKVWKIIFLIIPFLLLLGTVASILQEGEDTLSERRVYNTLTEMQSKSWENDHKLLEGFFYGNQDDKEKFGRIEKAFPPMENTIDRDYLSASLSYIDTRSIDSHWWIFTSIFVIFSFLVLEGLISMVYLSVYKIIQETKEN